MSEDRGQEGGGVFYSFETLLGQLNTALTQGFDRIDRRLDEVNRKIDSKADNTRVAELEKRHAEYEISVSKRIDKIDGPDGRLKPLEDFVLTNSAVALIKGKGLAFLGTLMVAIIGALVYLAFTGGPH